MREQEQADAKLSEAVDVFARLVQDYPRDVTYRIEFAEALHIRAENLYLLGRSHEANESWSRCLNIWRELIRENPANVEIKRQLGLTLCDWLDPALRDPADEVRSAKGGGGQIRLRLLPGFAV